MLEEKVNSLGFIIRQATIKDLPQIFDLIAEESGPFTLEQITKSDFYRTIQFGFFPLLVNDENQILGFNATEAYADIRRTASTVYVLVSKKASGYRLGVTLSRYTSLLCMEAGCKIKRTWIGPENYPSFKNHLNHEGYMIDGFYPDLYMPGQPRFTITLPLTPDGLSNNCIDDHRLALFLNGNSNYKLLDCSDLSMIENLYNTTNFKIVALVSKQITGKYNAFLAIPSQSFDSYKTS